MPHSNLAKVRRNTPGHSATSRRAAAEAHTVARYRLRLVREEEEAVAEPEALILPSEIAAFLWKRVFQELDREAMCAVYVNSMRQVIGWTVAYVGCLSRCSVEPRGLVVPALLLGAGGLAIAHNHPGGSPEPSEPDKFFTQRMQVACDILELKLIDSLVVAGGPTGPRWQSILSAVDR